MPSYTKMKSKPHGKKLMDSYNNSDDWNDYYEAILPKSINFSKTSSTQTFRYSRSHRRAKSYTFLIKELLEQVQEDLTTEVDIDLNNAQLSLLDILEKFKTYYERSTPRVFFGDY